ncbi:hypothetical protein Bca4012_009766 [Brassica carinata]|uniref:Uncharacterized protein n=1 Tax=Brassica carinata TaxID=52824 RepID=A0A8X7RZT5_BRACI|nr:hypothetical protein Bca52824_034995 [Brassica carinata]
MLRDQKVDVRRPDGLWRCVYPCSLHQRRIVYGSPGGGEFMELYSDKRRHTTTTTRLFPKKKLILWFSETGREETQTFWSSEVFKFSVFHVMRQIIRSTAMIVKTGRFALSSVWQDFKHGRGWCQSDSPPFIGV